MFAMHLPEEDVHNDGTLFGPEFGRKAKEQVDTIKSLASSLSQQPPV